VYIFKVQHEFVLYVPPAEVAGGPQ